jgi:uncharacterized protein (TIGR02452 family)
MTARRLSPEEHDKIHRKLDSIHKNLTLSKPYPASHPLPLDQNTKRFSTTFCVTNEDSLEACIDMKNGSNLNPCVLNMASEFVAGGGWRGNGSAQEECLFRQSTLALSLEPLQQTFYPIPTGGGIYSPRVLVWANPGEIPKEKDEMSLVSVVSVPGVRNPILKNGWMQEPEIKQFEEKIRTIFRIAVDNGHDSLVLGALGCGCFRCPTEHVAILFKQISQELEFMGRFKAIRVAIFGCDEKSKQLRRIFSTMFGIAFSPQPKVRTPSEPFVYRSFDFPRLNQQ